MRQEPPRAGSAWHFRFGPHAEARQARPRPQRRRPPPEPHGPPCPCTRPAPLAGLAESGRLGTARVDRAAAAGATSAGALPWGPGAGRQEAEAAGYSAIWQSGDSGACPFLSPCGHMARLCALLPCLLPWYCTLCAAAGSQTPGACVRVARGHGVSGVLGVGVAPGCRSQPSRVRGGWKVVCTWFRLSCFV